MSWRFLCSRSNLNLGYTLRNGQSFCWRTKNEEGEIFVSVLEGRVISLRNAEERVEFFIHKPISDISIESVTTTSTTISNKKRSRDVISDQSLKRIKKGKKEEEKEEKEDEEEVVVDDMYNDTFHILKSYFQLGANSRKSITNPESDRTTSTSTVITSSSSSSSTTNSSYPSSNKKRTSSSTASLSKVDDNDDDILKGLYAQWALADERMRIIVEALPGMRILRQPPVECLFSFICSSNNNISRITQMLDKLRQKYGKRIDVYDTPQPSREESLVDGDESRKVLTFYEFPTPEALSAASEEELRGLGLGYRAKFIRSTAILLTKIGGEEFLMSLRKKTHKEVQSELLKFDGVGMKVADCVALFSLDQSDCIPVDTHVWNIACCYFDRSLVNFKSLTPTVYEKVGDLFRNRYGASHAGWAHSLLFAAELPSFRTKLPNEFQIEMAKFKEDEKTRKAEVTEKKRQAKAKVIAAKEEDNATRE